MQAPTLYLACTADYRDDFAANINEARVKRVAAHTNRRAELFGYQQGGRFEHKRSNL